MTILSKLREIAQDVTKKHSSRHGAIAAMKEEVKRLPEPDREAAHGELVNLGIESLLSRTGWEQTLAAVSGQVGQEQIGRLASWQPLADAFTDFCDAKWWEADVTNEERKSGGPKENRHSVNPGLNDLLLQIKAGPSLALLATGAGLPPESGIESMFRVYANSGRDRIDAAKRNLAEGKGRIAGLTQDEVHLLSRLVGS